MKALSHKAIIYGVILILVLFSFTGFIGTALSENDPDTDNDTSNSGTSSSSSRARDSKNENSQGDFGDSKSSATRLDRSGLPWTLTGYMSNNADRDWFKIDLNAESGANYVDNLSVTVTSMTGWWYTMVIAIYGEFEDDDDGLILLRTEEYTEWDFPKPFAWAHAYRTGTYYIKVQEPFAGTGQIDYTLTVAVQQVMPEDYNNVIDDAFDTVAPPAQMNLTVSMDRDMFDWYTIDSPPSEGYDINFSFDFEIIDSPPVHQANTNPVIYFYTVAIILILHENYPGSGEYSGTEIRCNKQNQCGYSRKLNYYEFTEAEKTWVGIYVQAIGRDESGNEIEIELGDGYMDGWVEYKITKMNTVTVIPPILTGVRVTESAGNTYQTYIYNATYYDANNDSPRSIYIKIDDFPAATMKKKDKSDKNYVDGVAYEYSIDGTVLGVSDFHFYRIYASDKENDAWGDSGKKNKGPIISNNVPPFVRDSAPPELILYEDFTTHYFELNQIFEDSDNDSLYYSLWDEQDGNWTENFITENFELNTINTNGTLRFIPKSNKYNRLTIDSKGGDKVLINVTDAPENDAFLKGNKLFYVEQPWELEVVILSVNDPPEINRSFSSFFFGAELVMEEDGYYDLVNLSDVFHDPVEHDPLTFSTEGNYHIDILIHPNGTINVTPYENWTGTEAVMFTASDGQDSVSDTLRITVETKNDPPILNHTAKQIAYEDSWFNVTFTAYDHADGGELTFSTNIAKILGLTKDVYNFNEETGELSFKPNNDMVGVYDNVLVSVNDEFGASDSEYVTFEIINTPDPPIPKIDAPRDGGRFLSRIGVDFEGTVDDPDLNIEGLLETIRYSWYSDDELLGTAEDLHNQILSEGIHIIVFEVSDGVFTRNTSISIEVLAYNQEDTDSDGIFDYWELYFDLSHLDPRDAKEDPDGDGYTNLEEFLGTDGSPFGDDDTDPWDDESYPIKQSGTPPGEDGDSNGILGGDTTFDWIVFGVLSILILFLVIFILISQETRKRRKRIHAKKMRLMKQRMAAMGGGPHHQQSKTDTEASTKPKDITCHKCGKKTKIKTLTRPLVLTCPSCETKGVIYE